MKWTKENEEVSINLLEQGLTYEKIGILLNRSGKSVKEKLGKLGYKRENYIINNTIKINCLECNICFETNDHERKFCGSSCAGSYNGRKFPKRKSKKEKQYKCLNCGERNKTYYNTFCSLNCYQSYKNLNKISTNQMGRIGIKNFLIKTKGAKCEECGWDKINPVTKKIPIQLDHIDGNHKNNNLNNFRLLCPNCHSLTPTFMALNKGNGKENRKK